jgi:hypothetical protein
MIASVPPGASNANFGTPRASHGREMLRYSAVSSTLHILRGGDWTGRLGRRESLCGRSSERRCGAGAEPEVTSPLPHTNEESDPNLKMGDFFYISTLGGRVLSGG